MQLSPDFNRGSQLPVLVKSQSEQPKLKIVQKTPVNYKGAACYKL